MKADGMVVAIYMEFINDNGYVYESTQIAEFKNFTWANDFIDSLEARRTEHTDFRVELKTK